MPGFELLKLPIELRLMVIEIIMGYRTIHIECVRNHPVTVLGHSICSWFINPAHHLALSCVKSWNSSRHKRLRLPSETVAFLRLSRQIYNETITILYGKNVFIISEGLALNALLLTWSPNLIPQIKYLTLVFGDRYQRGIWDVVLRERHRADIVRLFTGVESLHLVNKIMGAWTQCGRPGDIVAERQGDDINLRVRRMRLGYVPTVANKLRRYNTNWTGNPNTEIFTPQQRTEKTMWDDYTKLERFKHCPRLKHVKVSVDDNWLHWMWRQSPGYRAFGLDYHLWTHIQNSRGLLPDHKFWYARDLLEHVIPWKKAEAYVEARPYVAVATKYPGWSEGITEFEIPLDSLPTLLKVKVLLERSQNETSASRKKPEYRCRSPCRICHKTRDDIWMFPEMSKEDHRWLVDD